MIRHEARHRKHSKQIEGLAIWDACQRCFAVMFGEFWPGRMVVSCGVHVCKEWISHPELSEEVDRPDEPHATCSSSFVSASGKVHSILHCHDSLSLVMAAIIQALHDAGGMQTMNIVEASVNMAGGWRLLCDS
jgi:hypothetical protein